MRAYVVAVMALGSTACVGTAGGDLFEFDAVAVGAAQAEDGTYSFESGRGFDVTLTQARVHVGAVYLNQAVATSVSSDTSCTLAGIYVAEVTSGLDVDALSRDWQPFPVRGHATADHAPTGEVWLTGGDINEEADPTVILDVAGTAQREDAEYPFEGELTIGTHRIVVPPNPALPGAKPICKQRVVSPIRTDITPREGGTLVLHIDPAGMFGNVDFTTLEPGPDGIYRFADDASNQASDNLYSGLRASAGVYSFSWE